MKKTEKIYIDVTLCKGCNLCIDFCPKEALRPSETMNKKGVFAAVVDEEKCNVCGTCVMFCPDFAIFKGPNTNTLDSKGA